MARRGRSGRGGRAGALIAAALLPAAAPAAPTAAAAPLAETRAGTVVTNTATARADGGSARSDAVETTVAERLDVALAAGGTHGGVAAATLRNAGNGDERFVLTARDGGGHALGIAVDRDGDGAFDPARDERIDPTPDGRGNLLSPAVAPGGSLALLVLTGDATGAVLTAAARTGTGAPGTPFPHAGDGGGDAVAGPTGGVASIALAGAAAPLPPSIVQEQSVAAPRPGAVVTYTITVRFHDASAAARVRDPIPANTRYRANSLTLDGVALADAGRVDADAVEVALGPVAAGAERRISFQTVIQGDQ